MKLFSVLVHGFPSPSKTFPPFANVAFVSRRSRTRSGASSIIWSSRPGARRSRRGTRRYWRKKMRWEEEKGRKGEREKGRDRERDREREIERERERERERKKSQSSHLSFLPPTLPLYSPPSPFDDLIGTCRTNRAAARGAEGAACLHRAQSHALHRPD